MTPFNCCRCTCVTAAVIVSAILGVVAAFLQMSAVIAVTPAFLWVVFGVAVVYLAVVSVSACGCAEQGGCLCAIVRALLAGILGTVLFAVILLAVDVAATGVIGSILVGLLIFFFSLTLSTTACLARQRFSC